VTLWPGLPRPETGVRTDAWMHCITQYIIDSAEARVLREFLSFVHKGENISTLDSCLRRLITLEFGTKEDLADHDIQLLFKFAKTIDIWSWIMLSLLPQFRDLVCLTSKGGSGLDE
jgi:hypothetical protein